MMEQMLNILKIISSAAVFVCLLFIAFAVAVVVAVDVAAADF